MTRKLLNQYADQSRAHMKIGIIFLVLIFLLSNSQSQTTMATTQTSDLLQTSDLATTNWEVETVDSGIEVGVYASLALDSNGYPHIAYIIGGSDPDSTMDDGVSYAYKDAGGWHTQSVPLGLVDDEYA